MQSTIPWTDIKSMFARQKCFSIGTVDEDGTPRVSPIGSVALDDEGHGHYFEHFPKTMRNNLDRDPRLCIMATRGGLMYWVRSLWRGAFPAQPALRLVAEAGPRRKATDEEKARWVAQVRPFRRLKGHDMLWGGMEYVRDFTVVRVEPVGLGKMTPDAATSPMEAIRSVPAIRDMLDDADHVDAKAFTGGHGLREFLRRMINYEPCWFAALMNVRGVVAKLLGLKHGEHIKTAETREVNLAPGGMVGFFKSVAVDDAESPRWWIGDASDKHLAAKIAVVAAPAPDGAKHVTVATIVHYRHWTGPLYFNLIRPFHHLVVHAMGTHAAGGRECDGGRD